MKYKYHTCGNKHMELDNYLIKNKCTMIKRMTYILIPTAEVPVTNFVS
jgi:seryl-tRNA synthetase